MSTIQVTRTIDAPVHKVFDTIADIRNFSKAVPDIVDVEFLSESKTGVGTRFRETRVMNGKEASTELEVTEYEQNRHIRIVSDSFGTVWDSVFTVKEVDGQTKLELTMDANAKHIFASLMNLFTKRMIERPCTMIWTQ